MRRTVTAILMAWLCIAQMKAQMATCDTAFFAYSDTVFCMTDPVQFPDTLTPLSGFFQSDSGLVVDSLGYLDPGASSPGIYNLNYIAQDSCMDTFTVVIRILPSSNASFTYSDTLFCVPGANPFPIIVGDSGGIFGASSGLILDSLNGLIDLGLSSSGSHLITYIVDSLCSDTSSFNLTIANTGNASFLYPDTSYCTGGQNPAPVVVGDQGGMFQVPIGLSVNSSSGIVNLNQCLPGMYPVTYVTSGLCSDTATFFLSITESQNPNFSYPSPLCLGDTNPLPTVTVPGGLFSALSGGLVFANTTTGEIDLTNSQPDSYQIRYVTPGPCPDSSVAVVIIQDRTPADFHYPDTNYCNGSPIAAPVIIGQGGGTFFALDSSLVLDSLTGFINLPASQIGVYTILYASPGICPDTTSFVLEVAPQGVAAFDYIPGQYCISDPNPFPIISGDSNGVFSVAYGGAVVDPFSGEINLGVSVPGDSILIQYNVPGIVRFCPDSTLRLIRIFSPDSSVTLSYPQSAFCPDDQDPIPTITGQSGGTFQANPPGLVLSSQFTGEIDLSASLPGTYLIRYFPPGACTDTLNGFSVTINPRDVVTVSYPFDEYCTKDGMAVPVGLSDSLGNFLEPTGFLTFTDPALGGIDLDSSRAGAYLIRYTSGGSCPEDTILSITIHESPDGLIITNPDQTTICEEDTMDFLGFGGDQFAFSLNDSVVRGFQYNNLFRPDFGINDGDRFTLTVRNDLGGCIDHDSVTIIVRPTPSITFLDYDSTLSSGESFQVRFQVDIDSVIVDWWYYTDGQIRPTQDSGNTPQLRAGSFWQNELVLGMETGNEVAEMVYFLRPRSGGCLGPTHSLTVLVLPDDEIFIPEVMTPNGDGSNDVWEIRHKANVPEFQYIISVFNRSGGKVYSQEGLAPVWDGGTNPDGVYWWVIENRVTKNNMAGMLTIRRK